METNKLPKSEDENKHLINSGQLLECIVRQASNSILLLTQDLKIVFANDAALKLTGHTIEEVTNSYCYFITYNLETPCQAPDHVCPITQCQKTGQPATAEHIHTTPDGKQFFTEVKVEQIVSPGGDIYYLHITRDISRQKENERMILQQNVELQKINMEKDKLFSIIAHDLRSPFQGFLNIAELIANEFTSMTAEEINIFTKNLVDSSRNVFNLLENLLEWSLMQRKMMEFKQEKIFLKTIVNEGLEFSKASALVKDIKMKNEIADDVQIYADTHMLKSVIRNLLSNAVKFTTRGGAITIAENGGIISIHDTGIG
ncbi:MAG: hypothetical protein CO133_02990, partial [Candidatus Komeilibacteria bacterium CG_4_9_14_3_um_filter_37_5]